MDISLGTLLHYLWGFFQFTPSPPGGGGGGGGGGVF